MASVTVAVTSLPSDLTCPPLACLAAHIRQLAADLHAEQYRIALIKEQLSLLRRDLNNLLAMAEESEFGAFSDMVGKALRRKLTLGDLESLHAALASAVDKLSCSALLTEDPSSNDNQNEQHQYSTDKKS